VRDGAVHNDCQWSWTQLSVVVSTTLNIPGLLAGTVPINLWNDMRNEQ
jgi:hypothetical protein